MKLIKKVILTVLAVTTMGTVLQADEKIICATTHVSKYGIEHKIADQFSEDFHFNIKKDGVYFKVSKTDIKLSYEYTNSKGYKRYQLEGATLILSSSNRKGFLTMGKKTYILECRKDKH